MGLDQSVKYLKGVGPKRAELFEKLGVFTVRDLVYHFPRSYIDLSKTVMISDTALDEMNAVRVRVVKKRPADIIRKNMRIYRVVCTDGVSDMNVIIYNSVYLYNRLREGEDYILYGKVTGNLTSREISSPMVLSANAPDRIIPVYPLTAGLSAGVLRGCVKNALAFLDGESCEALPAAMIKELGFMPCDEALRQVHFPQSMGKMQSARKRLAFDELLDLQLGMLSLRRRNRSLTAYALKSKPLSGYYGALPFELTGAQKQAIAECVRDMTQSVPMNRLILGDVGSGKTAVAAACCYFAYLNGCQSCLMAPTEILADQHYKTLCGFLEPLGVRVALLKGSLSAREKSAVRQGLEAGEYDVAVGTHALIGQSTRFKRLALVITDEQHRFGVGQRGLLAEKGENPHRLVMSATPIPRTLALMIYGELDISILGELPKGRLAVKTYAVTGKLRERAYGFVAGLLKQGRQAYVVCPSIEDEDGSGIKNVTGCARELKNGMFKEFRLAVLHGQMPPQEKESVMQSFKDGRIDLLVSTTVVEVGVDVPNAAIMLIEDADRFGLSQLHQLRGRVGRGSFQSYCILITDSRSDEAKKRLRTLVDFPDGFKISEMDLQLRGPGNFFGEEQHGLPKLKIADAADSHMITSAREEAERLFESGYLGSSQGERLARRVKRLFDESSLN